jgi:hypothetical protein
MVRAVAACYTAKELRDMLKDALAKLNTGSVITAANTGSGTGYTRTLVMSPEEAVELYQLCIEYKEGSTVNPVQVEHFYDPGTIC